MTSEFLEEDNQVRDVTLNAIEVPGGFGQHGVARRWLLERRQRWVST
ncbi:hypothetical protein OV208_12200 [Corallococcus sp. bb12-1]|nr:hypothetical protein [Corallococcus sp. bb12-1]MCY1042079.1 hypothetical protein [Corallococcus sp. bb12-1]